jgi:transcriptional regulator
MYIPEVFKIDDEETIHTFIRTNPFATLVTNIKHRPVAAHIPIDALEDGKYYGHLAIHNPLASISEAQEVLSIFSGPHAYISPRVYLSEFNVPTWDYSAVHCYGKLRFIDDETEVWRLLQLIVARHEGVDGWVLPDETRYKELTKAIRLFEFRIDTIEAKSKFSQNKSADDIQSIIQALRDSDQDEAADYLRRQSVQDQTNNQE